MVSVFFFRFLHLTGWSFPSDSSWPRTASSYGSNSSKYSFVTSSTCFIDKEFTTGNDFELVEFHYFLKGKPVEEMKYVEIREGKVGVGCMNARLRR